MKRTLLFLLLVSLFETSCHEESAMERTAERFLTAYFECRFADAERVASSKAVEQLRWRASQLTQADLDLLAENEPQVCAENVEIYDDSCVVYMNVSDALLLDSIGKSGHIDDQRYRIILKKEKGRNWIVTALIPNL